MKLLLDTHLLLWWEAGDPKLPPSLKTIVDEADAVFISQVSLWEIAVKISIGKLRLDVDGFTQNVSTHGFQWLDIRNTHLVSVASLPQLDDHKDPFDRLLIAQSQSEPLLFVTADKKLVRYGNNVKIV